MGRVVACRPFRWTNPFADIGLKYRSLEFSDSEKEMAFARGSARRLAAIMQVVGLVLSFIHLGWCLRWIIKFHILGPTMAGSVIADMLKGLACLLLALASRLHWRHGKFRSRHFEIICAFLMLMHLLLAQMNEPHIMSRFLRVVLGFTDPEVPQFSEGCQVYIILNIDGIVTLASLLPARWSTFWPLYVCAMLWYPMFYVAYYGISESLSDFVYQDLGALSLIAATLVVCSILGKRSLEAQDRRQFNVVITERTLRAETEFKMSQQHDGLQQRSDAPTLATADVLFDCDRVSVEARTTLERVTDVAKREQWLIAPEDISIHLSRLLGKGGFGVVVEGSAFGLPVAVKMSLERVQKESAKRFLSFINEVRILRKLRHPNIVCFQGAVIDPVLGELALVLELVAGLDLYAFTKRLGAAPSDRLAYRLFCGMSHALMFMHAHKPAIVHGDLKPANILVEFADSEAPRAKLTDFGLSRILSGSVRRLGGTQMWVAPEVMASSRHPDTAVDVYGLGRIALFMFSGTVPFVGCNPEDMCTALRLGNFPGSKVPESGASVTLSYLWRIAKVCCSYSPDDRPDMRALCDELRCLSTSAEVASQLGGLAHEFWGSASLRGLSVDGDGGTTHSGGTFGSKSARDSSLTESSLDVSKDGASLRNSGGGRPIAEDDSGPLSWSQAVPRLRQMMLPESRRSDEEVPGSTPTIERSANRLAQEAHMVDIPEEIIVGSAAAAGSAELLEAKHEVPMPTPAIERSTNQLPQAAHSVDAREGAVDGSPATAGSARLPEAKHDVVDTKLHKARLAL